MNIEFEKYSLSIKDNLDLTCSVSIYPKEEFALKQERRKLYVIYSNDEILYVGEAKTSILKRFQRGTVSFNHFIRNGKSRNGYKGYKWLNKKDNATRELKVAVVVFDSTKDNDREFIEAVEGEIVYLIRNKLGYWPKFQNEIHFSNSDVAKVIAEDILIKFFGNLF
jgi:hypothetical protein